MKYPDDFINKIIHGDCLEVMKHIPDSSVDITLTSPPYNFGTSKRYPDGRYDENDDSMDISEYRNFIFNTIDELLRVTKHYVFFNIQRGYGNGTTVFDIFGKYAPKIKDVFIWAKTNPPNGGFVKGLVASGHEYIFCFSNYNNNKRSFERFNFKSEDYIKNVIIKPVNSDNFKSTIKNHNAQFPNWLPYYFIQYFSFKGDLILDPFLGTGQTSRVCKELGRDFIGIDKDIKYCEIAERRLSQEYLF